MLKHYLQRIFTGFKRVFNPKTLLKAYFKPKSIDPVKTGTRFTDKKVHFSEMPTLYITKQNGTLKKINNPTVKAFYGNKDWGAPRHPHQPCTF